MQVVQLDIRNLRNIKEASLSFGGHTLFLGLNNAGKSTVCEALDLVLGPDRLTRFPPVEEFDFYNAKYSAEQGAEPINIDVQVSLIGLSDEVLNKCAPYLSHWHLDEKRVLGVGEADLVDCE